MFLHLLYAHRAISKYLNVLKNNFHRFPLRSSCSHAESGISTSFIFDVIPDMVSTYHTAICLLFVPCVFVLPFLFYFFSPHPAPPSLFSFCSLYCYCNMFYSIYVINYRIQSCICKQSIISNIFLMSFFWFVIMYIPLLAFFSPLCRSKFPSGIIIFCLKKCL